MTWTLTDSLDEYLAAAGEMLRARPVLHTVELTAIETLRAKGSHAYGPASPLFGWWQAAGRRPEQAMLHTPPYPVLLTDHAGEPRGAPGQDRPHAESLTESLAASGRQIAGVNSAEPTANQFAAAWTRLTGAVSREHRRSRLFRLAGLEPPVPSPAGRPRVATSADRDLLTSWFDAFAIEVHDIGAGRANIVDDRISYGGLMVWEGRDGTVVSMAAFNRPAAGVYRVGPVYTPPEQRRRGYAAGATAAISQAAIDAGAAEVVLFTDLANPTSNALYQRLGYRPVTDRLVLAFD